jgi:monovalent cation/proton antiporter MnhG/PhaG subunit
MSAIIATIGYIFILISLFLLLTVVMGLIKFNNIYLQIHIVTINDMVAFPLAILGIALLFISKSEFMLAIKLFFATVLWYIMSPISNYVIIKLAYFYNKSFKIKKSSKEQE